jgi:MYXO-CTERM domain-containing protein
MLRVMARRTLARTCSAALLLLAFAGSRTARAAVLWRGDFETGDLSQWDTTLNLTTGSRTNISVVSSPVFAGQYAGELVIHPDDLWSNAHNRVELHYDAQRTGEGETTFFSWYFFLPQNVQVHDDIGYWESAQSYQQTMAFYVEPTAAGMDLSFRTNRPSGMRHFTGPLTASAWHQLAMQILWSTDAGTGRVSVWLDGALIVDDVPAQTKPDANAVFVQVGFHRNQTETPVETIYVDNAVEGTTLGDVLAQPTGGAGAAGASGASNATGGGGGAGGGAGAPATGGAPASGGSGGAATGGTVSSGGAAATGGSAGSARGNSDEDDGCGCRVAAASRAPLHVLVWGLAALALSARRRRRDPRDRAAS